MDVHRLIEEVKKRPTLWDSNSPNYNDRAATPHLWLEIGNVMNMNVNLCKRKWKNLRDAFRAEIRRNERRSQQYENNSGEPLPITTSKWIYFEPMSFIFNARGHKPINSLDLTSDAEEHNASSENSSPDSGLANHKENNWASTEVGIPLGNACNIKMESQNTTDEDDLENDMLMEEFVSMATPQAVRRLSETLASMDDENKDGNEEPNCKCRRQEDQMHFLEDLEREEQKLIKSTRQEITRDNSLCHVGDSDYNFLVSFLPQMKRMSEVQNLRFRVKMSELVLKIISSSNAK